MKGYGEAAILAVEIVSRGVASSPKKAWELATAEVFPNSPSMRDKGCPKGAFLGLCEDGFIRGIPKGTYTQSRKNKEYAVRAVRLLKEDQYAPKDPFVLWSRVMAGDPKNYNQQMDVVLALWENGYII